MATLQHDNDGFLTGNATEEAQRDDDMALDIWRGIQGDTAAIRKALVTQSEQATKAARVATPARVQAEGKAIAQIASMAKTVQQASREQRVSTPVARVRGTDGRFLPIDKSGTVATPQRGGNGQFSGGGSASGSPERFGRATELLGDAAGRLASVADRTEQIDPTIAAANEIKSVVSPIAETAVSMGKGVFGLFNKERGDQAVPWYKKILKELKILNEDKPGGSGGSGFLSTLFGGIGSGISSIMGWLSSAFAGLMRIAPFLAKLAVPFAAIYSAVQSFSTSTEEFAKRMGVTAGQSLVKDLGIRFVGVLGDLGNTLTLGLAGKFGEWLSQKGHEVFGFMKRPDATPMKKADVSPVSTGNASADENWAKNGGAIVGAAQRAGVDPATMAKLSRLESAGFKSDADAQLKAYLASGGKKGSTASGLYQFLDGTWASQIAATGSRHAETAGLVGTAQSYLADKRGTFAKRQDPVYAGLFAAKNDAAAASVMGADLTAENIKKLRRAGFANPGAEQIYSMHMTGNTNAALAMKKNPTGDYRSAFSDAEIRNNPMFFRGAKTTQDVFANMRKELDRGEQYANAATNKSIASNVPSVSAAPSIPQVPSAAPDVAKMQLPPAPTAPPTKLNGSGKDGQSVTVNIPREIGQNVSDRGVAQVVTGGLGGYTAFRG
jgi:hypothetical protein